jgi:hypothetical protein
MTKLILVLLLFSSPVYAQSLFDWNPKANWDSFYNVGAEGAWGHPGTRPEIRLNYHRWNILQLERVRIAAIARALGWNSTTAIHLVNCGFGWVLEALAEMGITKASCSTTSTYIQTAKNTNEDIDILTKVAGVGLATNTGDGLTLFTVFRGDGSARAKRAADILNEDLKSNTSRRNVRDKIGQAGFDVISYDGFTNSMTDAEAVAFSDSMHRLPGVGRVIHHVFDWLNSKTLDQWKALLPNDFFIAAVTYEVR